MAGKQPKVGDWTRLLLRNKEGVLRKVAANAITALVNHPMWAGVLAYDEFAETIITLRVPPWRPQDMPPNAKPGDWTDEDTTRVQAWLADIVKLDVGDGATLAAVKVVAARTRVHPVRDWLQGLKWDGKRRVGTWLVDVMGCEDTPYVREVGASFLIGGVARIMRPGCKVDTTPIFEGEQGTFKSSTLRALVGDEWFLEMGAGDILAKDAMQVLRRKWIAELPEFDAFVSSRAEASHVKGFFSKQVDTYRPSYGKGSRDFPRQTVFAGTTNKTDYLGDETGARRWHPLRCRRGDVALATGLRDQLWAEAVALYESGVPWHVTDPELIEEFKREQDERFRPHPWLESMAAWLRKPVDVGMSRAQLGVTTGDVLTHALTIDVGKRTQNDANVVAMCLRKLGWTQRPQCRRNGARVRLFFPDSPAEWEGVTAPDDEPIQPVTRVIPLPEFREPEPFEWPNDADFDAMRAE